MPKFQYVAYTKDGKLEKGVIDAQNQDAIAQILSSKELIPISIELAKERSLTFGFSKKIKERDLSLVLRQIGFLIQVGISVPQAFEMAAKQINNQSFKNILLEVSKDVSEGLTVGQAMQKRKNVFPPLLISLVITGEETGQLDRSMILASDYYEKLAKIKGKIKSASFYPSFVLIIATIITTGIIYFLVPIFASIYKGFGASLPLPTLMLLKASNFLHENILTFVVVLVAFSFIFKRLYQSNMEFRKRVETTLLKIPVIGNVFHKIMMNSFATSLSSLFSSGVSLDRSLELIAQTSTMQIVKEGVEKASKAVREGKPLWIALKDTGLFDELFISMVKIGEDTGRLDDLLQSIVRFYEEEVDKAIDAMISLIEPTMIVIIGGIIGVILIALYMPIFKIGSLIKS
ncbi:type II secretion system F family protein [Hydrogenobaculum acidophilum]